VALLKLSKTDKHHSTCVAQNKPSTMSSSTVLSIDPTRATRPDSSGWWDNWMAAQHLPWYPGGLAVDKRRTGSNERRRPQHITWFVYRQSSACSTKTYERMFYQRAVYQDICAAVWLLRKPCYYTLLDAVRGLCAARRICGTENSH